MRKVTRSIDNILRLLDDLEQDSTKWQVPDNVLIIDRYADAYAVGFQEAIRQLRLRISKKMEE